MRCTPSPAPGLHLLVMVGAIGACGPELRVGAPPDIAGVVEDYRAPFGSVEETAGASFSAAVESGFETLSATGGFSFADEVVDGVEPSASDILPEDESGIVSEAIVPLRLDDLEAVIEGRYICDGFGSDDGPPVDPERDGRIEFEGAVDTLGFFPLFWGQAVTCRVLVFGVRTQLDGDISIFVDAGKSRIASRDITRSPLIVRFFGDLLAEESDVIFEDQPLDARILLQGSSFAVETRVMVDGELFVIGYSVIALGQGLPDLLTVVVRGRDGTWTCNLVTELDIGSCVNAKTGEEVVWE
ncbi:MAG: hypothetical protein ACFB9M_16500 [Myxococcota bacterium]